ncbi:glycoside hydrolase family 18 protein [Armillaria borealis]|uniref:Glycoside hydrolase family 18 protein n=1 Tax=Armillaria borealis TaxID=47425 RepID=A0AA39JPW7_9AGAR|nr:glycoside hydrolase family 18 protein [Armillaria borealis]
MLALNLLLAFLIGLVSASPTVFGNTSSPIKALRPRASTVPSPPHFVIYGDKWVSGLTGPPPVALSFLLVSGAFDKAEEWTQLTAAQRSTIKAQYAAAGIKLVVSVFGSTDKPTSSGANATATAITMAEWVKRYNLDGIDVDYEDFKAVNAGDGRAEAWIIAFTKELRRQLPQGEYILTHAPVAPWFTSGSGGAYRTVHTAVGDSIDWYNVQFYNQGTTEYTTCTGLLTTSSSKNPQTALFQIASSAGVPLSKLVIGKPGANSDASNGFMSTSTLASCLETAHSRGWNAGVSVWEFPDVAASWIQAVRDPAFPL